MKKEEFCRVFGEISESYVEEAETVRRQVRPGWAKWGAMAACLCLAVVGSVLLLHGGGSAAPDPDPVQIPNPMLPAASVEEMEEILDFDIPVLEKEIASCFVFVEDGYPVMGQVSYADGSEFRMQYGSGDISGIYGGVLEESRDVDGVTVEYCRYGDTAYALWEKGGFTFSYVYTGDGAAEVEAIIRQLP